MTKALIAGVLMTFSFQVGIAQAEEPTRVAATVSVTEHSTTDYSGDAKALHKETKETTDVRAGIELRIMKGIPLFETKILGFPFRGNAEFGIEGEVSAGEGPSVPKYDLILGRAGLTLSSHDESGGLDLAQVAVVTSADGDLEMSSTGLEVAPVGLRWTIPAGAFSFCGAQRLGTVILGSHEMLGTEAKSRREIMSMDLCAALDMGEALGEVRASGHMAIGGFGGDSIVAGIPASSDMRVGSGLEWRRIAGTPAYAGYRWEYHGAGADQPDAGESDPYSRHAGSMTHQIFAGVRGM